MPVWPKSFYTFGLSLQTAATEWKLRKKHAAPAAQDRVFGELTPRLGATLFWRAAGIEALMPYAKFQSRVPLQTYERLAPAIQRMRCGESDVLWPGPCALFALTSGTTGEPKHLPVTEEMLAHFRRGGLDALLYYTVRVRHAGVFRGRHLFYGGPATLTPIDEAKPREAFSGELTGIAALSLPTWADKHLYEPGIAVAQLADYAAKLDALVARSCSRDITMIAGLPNWVMLLAEELREKLSTSKRRVTNLQAHWPNLECYVHSGMSIAPHSEELRTLLGPQVKFQEVYAASEGIVAAQDEDAMFGLRVLADAGIFFEFLPMADFDESRLDQLGPKAVPLAGVKAGIEYAILLTTPGGLARYVLGDVVRFTSTEPPRLIHVGRTHHRLNTFQERVSEKDLTDALVTICRRKDWVIVNFHVAPSFALGSNTGLQKGRHEWWVELKPRTVASPTGLAMAGDLDLELQRINDTYLAKRTGGILAVPTVRLVMPGVFEHWMRYCQKWGGQYKVPRCRGDRLVADQLAQVTHFAVE